MSNKSFSGVAAALVILVPVIGIAGYLSFSYNGLVDSEEEVFTAWSQVESTYQRRADLVPNLVKTVQAFADQEMAVVQTVTDARTEGLKALAASAHTLEAATADAGKETAGSKDKLADENHLQDIDKSQKNVNDKITALMVMAEAYPDLRSSDSFMALQDQLEGSENRINVARMAFNEKAGAFNASIRRIPGSLVAALGGFQRKAYFKSDAGADKAPKVEFKALYE